MVSCKFIHGLGDCSNFAHQIPLYTTRGHEIKIECTKEKEALFLAGGASITHGKNLEHHYWRHVYSELPTPINHWAGNKASCNISKSPMPDIGHCSNLWKEYCQVELNLDKYVTEEDKKIIDDYLSKINSPIILCHFQGNTGPDAKNINHEIQAEIVTGLLSETDATIINLDWDNRVWKGKNFRVKHLKDFRHISVIELYYLMKKSNLLLGIDSGVLHFSRFARMPTLGLWTKHHPSHFVLPRKELINIVGSWANDITKLRRAEFNILEDQNKQISSEFIVKQAKKMFDENKYLNHKGPDLLLQQFLSKCRGSFNDYAIDRNRSFDLFLKHIKGVENPVVVETGCIRVDEDYSAGYSSYILGVFLLNHGGKLTTVDLNATNCKFAKSKTEGLPVDVVLSHSWNFLKNYKGPKIDALYLDSHDADLPGHEENCLEETKLALPHLAEGAVILIDDTPYHDCKWKGKGAQAIPWLISQGFKIKYAGYQVLLTK
jgi:hypothetical protein